MYMVKRLVLQLLSIFAGIVLILFMVNGRGVDSVELGYPSHDYQNVKVFLQNMDSSLYLVACCVAGDWFIFWKKGVLFNT